MSDAERRAWLRMGGRFVIGASVTTWSVAEGRRGRRWRSTTVAADGSWRSMLLEVEPNCRPSRLELATPAGLLTAHPEPAQATLHGNVVTGDGVRPITLPWGETDALVVVGEPISLAVAIAAIRQRGASEAVRRLPVIEVDPAFRVGPADWVVRPDGAARWRAERVTEPGVATWIEIDNDGILRAVDGTLVDRDRWSLEGADRPNGR